MGSWVYKYPGYINSDELLIYPITEVGVSSVRAKLKSAINSNAYREPWKIVKVCLNLFCFSD